MTSPGITLPSGRRVYLVIVTPWKEHLATALLLAAAFAAGFVLDHMTVWVGAKWP